jgi:hypothetical protein
MSDVYRYSPIMADPITAKNVPVRVNAIGKANTQSPYCLILRSRTTIAHVPHSAYVDAYKMRVQYKVNRYTSDKTVSHQRAGGRTSAFEPLELYSERGVRFSKSSLGL